MWIGGIDLLCDHIARGGTSRVRLPSRGLSFDGLPGLRVEGSNHTILRLHCMRLRYQDTWGWVGVLARAAVDLSEIGFCIMGLCYWI